MHLHVPFFDQVYILFDNHNLVGIGSTFLIYLWHLWSQTRDAVLSDQYKLHTKGAIIRSRSLYIEQGERSTKYFFNLEKRNQTVKNISSILSAEGIVTDPGQILEIEKQYYQDLYEYQHSHEDDL